MYGASLDAPGGPGWWAFEGSEWESKALYLVDGVETTWQEKWNEAAEEHWNRYEENPYDVHRYVDVKGVPFRTVLDVRWVRHGMSFSCRHGCGSHEGEPVLGFVSPKYRWNHALYAIDTLVGHWWLLTLPWKEE